MAITVQVYSNANSATRSITFDFVSDILAPDDAPANASCNASCNAFYFKVTTSAVQDNSVAFPVKIVRSLSDLALYKPGATGVTKHQRIINYTNAYPDIRSMVVDYTYDFINGHTANLYSSECTLQRPMKFT